MMSVVNTFVVIDIILNNLTLLMPSVLNYVHLTKNLNK